MTANILYKIRKHYRDFGRMPSVIDIGHMLGTRSKRATQEFINEMVDEGLLEKDRTGKLIASPLVTAIPLMGTVQAGIPTEVDITQVEMVDLTDYLQVSADEIFMLEVDGDSMIDAHICPGDRIIVERSRKPENGAIVVAVVDDMWTLKRYIEKAGERYLLAENKKKYKTPIKAKETLEIGGVVRSMVRRDIDSFYKAFLDDTSHKNYFTTYSDQRYRRKLIKESAY